VVQSVVWFCDCPPKNERDRMTFMAQLADAETKDSR